MQEKEELILKIAISREQSRRISCLLIPVFLYIVSSFLENKAARFTVASPKFESLAIF